MKKKTKNLILNWNFTRIPSSERWNPVNFNFFRMFSLMSWNFAVIYFARCFCLFPVDISTPNPQQVIFKWKSLRTVLPLLAIISSGLTSCCSFAYQASLGPLTARNLSGAVFFFCCCWNSICLFRVSIKWKILMTKWMKTETIFHKDSYRKALPKARLSLRKRLWIMTIVYITLSSLEHGLYLASDYNQISIEVETCNRTDRSFVEVFISQRYSFILNYLPFQYNHFMGFTFEYLSASYNVLYHFVNLLIILISFGLASLYEKINLRLKTLKRLIVADSMWSEIRCHHVQVSELVKIVNRNFNEIIIAASFSDGYFTLSQAINILTWVLRTSSPFGQFFGEMHREIIKVL